MEFKGIPIKIKNIPVLDPGFLPLRAFHNAFLKTARQSIALAVEATDGTLSVYETFIHGTKEREEADFYFIDRTLKFLLWARGGYRIYICGPESVYRYVKQTFAPGGAREFDYHFMKRVYEREIEICHLPYEQRPAEKQNAKAIGRNMDGCRIGFDAGGSDRKVSAMIDGEVVYSDETVWFPKTNADPDYHFDGIMDSLKKAAAHMPRVDGIGVSSAGVYINNRTMIASLFLKVPDDLFDKKVKDIYLRAAKEFGDIPVEVCNDGDVTALAGAMSLEDNNVLGIAMGTSEAAGYVDGHGNITGWLNELAFAPVDANPEAMRDEWSGDIGCGVKYFSQDGVIKLAPFAGIVLDEQASPAEKLKAVQDKMESGHTGAAKIYESIGCYLAHTLAYYSLFYDIRHVLLLGRVMSGKGGDILYHTAQKVLADEYPEIRMQLNLPDEKSRRVGQSAAAASLPQIRK